MNNENKVLACVDASPLSEVVTDCAAWAARHLTAPMELLHVLDRHPQLEGAQDHSGAIGVDAQEKLLAQLSAEDENRTRAARETGRLFLHRLRERALAAGVPRVDSRLRHGDIEETVAEQQAGSRLVVLGRSGVTSAMGQAHLGKHLEWVARSVNRPVLVATDTYREPTRVLFAFDGSSVTQKGVEMLARSPLLKHLPMHVLMVGESSQARQRKLDAAVATLRTSGMDVTSSMTVGAPLAAISQALSGQGFDMLVMGAYSHSSLRSLFMGSKTTELLRATHVPTLLLR